jgi:thiamine kinase-like enzyme
MMKLRDLETFLGYTWSQLKDEIHQMDVVFRRDWFPTIPVVFCHCDTQNGNFIFDSNAQTVKFIDFEHSTFNFYLLDLTNYFIEMVYMTPLQNVDWKTSWPSQEAVQYMIRGKRTFLIEYFKHATFLHKEKPQQLSMPTDAELERIYDFCERLIAPIQLYWSLFTLLQILLNPDLDIATFDYTGYAKWAFSQYQWKKADFFRPL